MNLDLAAIEAHDARMGAAWWCDRAHELLAAVRTLEAERDEQRRVVIDSVHWQRAAESRAEAAERRVVELEAQAEDCVAVVDLWQAKGVKYEAREYEARVTALEEAARQLIAKWEGIVQDCDAAGALLPHSGIVAEGFKVCAEELAAALLTKEG